MNRMESQRLIEPPETVTLYFCGQPGCGHQLEFKPNPVMAAIAGSAPTAQCPMHGMAVGPPRPVEYRRSATEDRHG